MKNVEDKGRYVFCTLPEEKQNFWEANPELLNLTPYAQFYKKEGKRRSGRIMTAIYMCFDPKSSAQNSGEREEEDIMVDIATHFLNDKKFDWSEFKTIINAYKLDCRTKIEKELDYWELELKTRRQYQRNLPWDTERKEKDEMLKTQKTLFQDMIDIRKELDKERNEKKFYAGTHKSLLERQ